MSVSLLVLCLVLSFLLSNLLLAHSLSLFPSFQGTWNFQSLLSVSSQNANLYICPDPNDATNAFQARYTENGNTIGFLYSTNASLVSLHSDTQLRVSGEWFEAGQHHGTFEMTILDVAASPLQAQFYIWYNNQKDTSDAQNASISDSSIRRYKYYSRQFVSERTSGAALNSITDCWVSDLEVTKTNRVTTGSGNDTSTFAFYEGQWLQGTDPISDSFFICQYNDTVGGRMFGVAYWHGETQMSHSIISGRWESDSHEGTMILKYVDNAIVGTFLVGLSNVQSVAQYALNPNGAPAKLTRNQSMTPTELQCIDMDMGFSGQWTESLHGETLYLCTKRDGTLYGSYTRQVQIDSVATSMPIAVIRGKVDSTTKRATGTWYEAGWNQRGNFVWNLDASTSTSFSGLFWSEASLVEGITVAGLDWSEKRRTWVASPNDCLENIFLHSNNSMEGFWSMPDFPGQVHPDTLEPFTNLKLTVCTDTSALSTVGVYHEKGDWQGNATVDHTYGFGYFKEHWTPVGVKIAGNVLFRMRHDNFSEVYHFEGEDNDVSTIGRHRVHTRYLEQDMSSRNCTPVFLSNGAIHGAALPWLCVVLIASILMT